MLTLHQGLRITVALVALAGTVVHVCGCRDASRFSTKGDHFEGVVVKGSFARAGVTEDTRMCVALDVEHLQDAPGTLTTSDGRFRGTAMRPIPQIWHDPLSTLSFGDGRMRNLMYVATPIATSPSAPPGDVHDVMVFISLMAEGGIEIRLVRGAPQADGSTTGQATASPMFGVFTLERHGGACSF